MFAGFLGWAGGAWNWFCKSPVAQLGAAAIGLLLAWSVAVRALKEEGKREQKLIHKAASERERAEMIEDRGEILETIQQDVEGARDAVDRMPQYRSIEQLRELDPELAALVLTDPD